MKLWKRLLPLTLAAALLAGCSQTAGREENIFIDQFCLEEVEIEAEAVALAAAPALSTLLTPVASGTKVEKNAKVTIDYSNITDGYVMVNYTAATDKRLKVKLVSPSSANEYYQYNLTPNTWTTFPLSDGNGEYKVSVLESTDKEGRYAVVASVTFQVTLKDEFAPFLRPNQYVDYAPAANTLAKAKELVGSETDTLKKVQLVYDFVVKNVTYDIEKAASVQSGYLPVLDTVLATGKGICFDYAALMVGMLRSQNVPCKLVVGYAGTQYHAWVSVWTAEDGWIDGVIYFDGTTWQRMDPTFASGSNSSQAILQYIGDGSNYTAKYFY